jgi:hypothetical protein
MRNTFKYTFKQRRGHVAKALNDVYHAPSLEVAEEAFAVGMDLC